MRIDSPISCNAQITGSFTGSFGGDGSNLTGVVAEWDGSHNGDATITGSLTISSDIIVDGTVDGVDVALLSTNYSLTSASAAANAVSITTLSGSAHTQRIALISSLSASADTHLDANISSLSSSAHSQRIAIKSGLNTDISSLSGSAHLQRVALDGAQTTALNSLSSSAATALRSEYKAGDTALSSSAHAQRIALISAGDSALSASAHTQRVALDSAQTTANSTLSSSLAAALTAEYIAADSALSSSQKTYIDQKVAGVVDSAPAALDTLNELAAALGDDPNFATTVSTSIGEKLAKASNLSDLADAATARTNLGVDTKANTWTGISGDISITSAGVATVADDSHNHIISNIDGLQAALDAKQAAGTYNTIIGTDTDIDTSGATIIDNLYMTDGVITSHGTRTLTLADLGYTGDSNANNYTHPTYAGDDINIDTGALTGATVISDLDFNITTDTNGHVTDANATVATRNLTLANLGFTGDSNANYITNNNQLTNGAGYITSYVNTTYSAGRGLDLSGTTFQLETDLRDTISYIGYDSNDYIQWSNNAYTRTVVNGTERLRVDTAGIDVSGRVVADGDIIAYSDERLKKDVSTIDNALEKTKQLRGVEFTRIADDSRSIGVIAQELEKVLPELVKEEADGMKAVNYGQITGLLIEAVKELSAKVDELSK